MTRSIAIKALAAATLGLAIAFAPAAFAADDMKKDNMSKDTMSKDNMSKDFDVEGQHVQGLDEKGYDEEGRHEEVVSRSRVPVCASSAGTQVSRARTARLSRTVPLTVSPLKIKNGSHYTAIMATTIAEAQVLLFEALCRPKWSSLVEEFSLVVGSSSSSGIGTTRRLENDALSRRSLRHSTLFRRAMAAAGYLAQPGPAPSCSARAIVAGVR